MRFLHPFLRNGATIAFSAFSTILFAQTAPGGVQRPTVWHAQADASEAIGNHYSFDLLNFENQVDVAELQLQSASTLFFVLKPRFSSPSGAEFLRLGDIRIFDDHIDYGRGSVALAFEENEPQIVSIQIQRPVRHGWRSTADMAVGDTSLFSIAELVVYPGILDREELRKVNTYLALKYSITITENTDSRWQDYLRSDNYTYWNTRIDRLYKERVIGLGRSDDERFYQTQTVTTTGEEITLALDELRPVGEMPNVPIDEDAFIIFSESAERESTSSLPCDESENNPNILHQWKFQLQNWGSEADHLVVRIPDPGDKQTDSLFVTDGGWFRYLPVMNQTGDDIVYQIPLSGLQDGVHYFFTDHHKSECENVEVDVEDHAIVVNASDFEDKTWTFETQSLNDGSLTSERVNGSTASRYADEGQYVVTILDGEGNLHSTQVVKVDNERNDPTIRAEQVDIRVYPDPVEQSEEATLSIRNLPNDSPVKMTVSGMDGRIYETAELPYSEEITRILNPLEIPGTYTVTVYQGSSIYAVKLIVHSR